MSTRTKLIIATLAIPAVAVAWWLGSPLLFDTTVDEAFPVVAAAPETTTATAEISTTTTPVAERDPVATTQPAEDTGPVELAIGTFRDADDFHRGSGTATVYELEDGSRVLRLSDFEVTNGPALRVYLVPEPDPTDPDQVEGYYDLGALKGNVGNQNYEIPADVDLSAYGSVVIYCQPFHVIFSVATLDA